MNLLHALWRDEQGVVISAEMIMALTLLVIGMAVGFTALRDAVVTELADTGAAIAALNQSFSYAGVIGHSSNTVGSFWVDLRDAGDPTGPLTGPLMQGIILCTNAVHEGS